MARVTLLMSNLAVSAPSSATQNGEVTPNGGSVGTAQLRNRAVPGVKLATEPVTGRKIRASLLLAGDV